MTGSPSSRLTAQPQQVRVLIAATATAGVLLVPHVKPLVQSLSAFCRRLYHQWFVLTIHQAKPSVHGNGSGTISQLSIHPVKSLRAVPQETAILDAKGLSGDRRFMMVVPNPPLYQGYTDPSQAEMRFLTQRQCPLLATVVVKVSGDGSTMTLSTDNLPGRTVSFSTRPPNDAQTYRSTLWGDTVLVEDMGEDAALFLQALAAADPDCPANVANSVRLVKQAPNDARSANELYVPGAVSAANGILSKHYKPPVALSDGFPILIASEASLEELNRRLVARNKAPIDMTRFRPNIVVRGTKPFEEDHWKVIRINDVVMHVVKGCPRCKQSCTDQTTGQVSDEPLQTLTEFRALNPANAADVFFGQNILLEPGMEGRNVKVGDELTVLQWTNKPVYEGD
ncbi:hypothetical protein MPSEU_000640700 [Mayamaea pseudoterrestris]|nr:hypothetical protein MPSEU_000640700 [Mayamaea pseudoterrestris]